jgi:integrase
VSLLRGRRRINLKKEPKRMPHAYVDKRDGLLYALFTYTDRFGKRRFVRRRARNMSHAQEIYKALEQEKREKGEEAIEARRMTFNQLADYAEKHFVKEPTFVDGMKVSGMKSWVDARQKLNMMRRYFGTKKIRDITADDIRAFRDERINTPTKRKEYEGKKAKPKKRSIASVQRELSLLRRVLNIARRRHWIPFNPFDEGGFISNAAEVKRTRVISREEETRLLLACEKTDERKDGKETKKKSLKHLRPIVICGIDTGMRSGEMFKLRWRDVNFDERSIHVIASNTKTEQKRDVPMTLRLQKELETLWKHSTQDLNELVFGMTRIKRGWVSLCREAKVYDCTPHSMRHTCATRLIEAGTPIAEVSRLLGHTNVITTYRYVNLTKGTVERAAAALDNLNEPLQTQMASELEN